MANLSTIKKDNSQRDCEHNYVKEVAFGQKTGDRVCSKCYHILSSAAYIVYSTPSPMPEKIGGMIGGFFSGCGLGAIIAAIVSAFIPS